jgi:ribulose-phosphate 3-epimerase
LLGDPISLIEAIHMRSMKAGVAISPDTPSAAITDEVGKAADMLLVMTVYPGKLDLMWSEQLRNICANGRSRRTEIFRTMRSQGV